MFSMEWAHSSTAVMHSQCITNFPLYTIVDRSQCRRPCTDDHISDSERIVINMPCACRVTVEKAAGKT
jgi:hypothetical protein